MTGPHRHQNPPEEEQDTDSSYAEVFDEILTRNWTRKFFLDYLLVVGKANVFNYKLIAPSSHGNMHYEYTIMPHANTDGTPLFHSKSFHGKRIYSFHDGKTNLDENVWWIVEVDDATAGPNGAFEYFPQDLVNIFNGLKIATFERYVVVLWLLSSVVLN